MRELLNDLREQGQRTTRYIKHWAESNGFNVDTFNKLCNGLTGKCFEMPNASYVCQEAVYWQ